MVTQNSNMILKLYLLIRKLQDSSEQSSLFLSPLLVSLQKTLSADVERVKHRKDVRVQQQHAAYVPEKMGTSLQGLEFSIHIMIAVEHSDPKPDNENVTTVTPRCGARRYHSQEEGNSFFSSRKFSKHHPDLNKSSH